MSQYDVDMKPKSPQNIVWDAASYFRHLAAELLSQLQNEPVKTPFPEITNRLSLGIEQRSLEDQSRVQREIEACHLLLHILIMNPAGMTRVVATEILKLAQYSDFTASQIFAELYGAGAILQNGFQVQAAPRYLGR